jgi:hypothetical protein
MEASRLAALEAVFWPTSSCVLVGASMLPLKLARDEPLLLAGSVSRGRDVLGAGGARLRGTLVTALHRS